MAVAVGAALALGVTWCSPASPSHASTTSAGMDVSAENLAVRATTNVVAPEDSIQTRRFEADLVKRLRAGGGERVKVWSTETQQPDAVVAGVPRDIFRVWSTWASWHESGKMFIAFYGRWAYKDGFIGSGAPANISAMALAGFPSRCWTKTGAGVVTNSESGARTSLGFRKGDGHGTSVWGITDRTRNFQLQNKYGMHWTHLRRDRIDRACWKRKAGSYYMEHNQGGTGGWSAAVSMGALAVSYSGSAGSSLQKAAAYSYY